MAEPSLLERLRASSLLPAEQVEELARLPQAGNPDPRALGRLLVERGLLTFYQVNLLAAGRGRELRVGQYILLERLGEGGMGQIFKARHARLGTIVALKLMRKEKVANSDAVARFYKEIQLVGQLRHPNIVQAFDPTAADQFYFYAMEFVDGPDLSRLVKEKGPLPVGRACEYARQAALGLQHAHDKGMVHRDIKPSNLLLATAAAGSETIKILDLGLARLDDPAEGAGGQRPLTRLGQMIGTPDYMPPEQAVDARKADARADIYSLGCTLFFLLTGRAPFQAATLAELLSKHRSEPPPGLRERRPEAPAALEALVARMLAKKREDRPQSAAEVAAALAPLCEPRSPAVPLAVPLSPPPPSEDDWAALGESTGGQAIVARLPGRRQGKNLTPLYVFAGVGAGLILLLALLASALSRQDEADRRDRGRPRQISPADYPFRVGPQDDGGKKQR